MSPLEIPLLRESAAFARRLVEGARTFGQPRYHFHRRVNWSYRYSETFYARESRLFQAGPASYLQGQATEAPDLDDVYTRPLRGKQVLTVVAKVLAHRLFAGLGRLADQGLRRDGIGIYRKAYVDDIELVFDPRQTSVVRAVYPFPINVKRQLRYLRFLHAKEHRFKLAGNPYAAGDFWQFLRQRNVRSLMRLESRAQVRHAREVAALGVHTVQLSDEFDIGSLDFARTLARHALDVVNSAHGVGKYFPVHAYQCFQVLTLRQRDYYLATRACDYPLRLLNDSTSSAGTVAVATASTAGLEHEPIVRLVFLSQAFAGISPIVTESEVELMALLGSAFAADPMVQLMYKPHPNAGTASAPRGFERLVSLNAVNGRTSTLFASFFSTCQIDPAFKGRKVLIRSHLIFPEIAFDASEPMFDPVGLVAYIRELTHQAKQAARP